MNWKRLHAYRTHVVTDGRTLVIDLPPDFPVGCKVEVIVMIEDVLPAQSETPPGSYRDSDDKIP
ncbi:MAG: hypothetical protein LBU53_02375 [Zoogloeaceae bacterium]|nr:hypothetical protein [Zoogloeaceae bacterium]